jgi:hypothetical protein
MSYINEIDIIIYESINEIYEDLKNEQLTKIKSFGKESLYLNLIEKYINKNNSKKKVSQLLKNKDQIDKIINIIEKYIIIYCILYFGIQLNLEKDIENSENVFVTNVLNISLSNKFSQLTSILNSSIINSYKLYNNINLIINKNLTDFEGELLYAKNFIDNDIGTDFFNSISKDNKDRIQNTILLIIFLNIYKKEDKTEIIKIFEEQNLKNSEFKYITIIDSKFEIIDYSTIESLLNIDEINTGLTQSLYKLLSILKFNFISLLLSI